jgi:hypothetical protein
MLIEAESIEYEAIKALANANILAIRVRNFISESLAKVLTDKIISSGYESYINAPSIGRIGMAFYETENNPNLIDEYFSHALSNIDELRNRCLPFASPIDLLRCRLDEKWPAGACLERLYGRKMFVGLSRVVDPNIYFLTHHDIFEKDAVDSYHARSLVGQFAGNVYLNIPKQGGELQIWERELEPQEFDKLRGDSYGISPDILGKPTIEIKPVTGDMVLFNSRKMHAVAPSVDTFRLSLSCFVGYRGAHSPLTFWS